MREVLGQAAADGMAGTIVVYLFGSCVAFMIIAGDTMLSLMSYFIVPADRLPDSHSNGYDMAALAMITSASAHAGTALPVNGWAATWNTLVTSRQVAVLLPAVMIMLPLSLKRTMGALASASTLAVAIMAVTAGTIAYRAVIAPPDAPAADLLSLPGEHAQAGLDAADAAEPPSAREIGGAGSSALAAFAAVPIMVFAYQCHVQAVHIFRELEPRPSLLRWHADASAPHDFNANSAAETSTTVLPADQPAYVDAAQGAGSTPAVNAKLRGMLEVLVVASCTCSLLYVMTGSAGARLFPNDVAANVLMSFDPSDSVMQALNACVGLAVVLHYPINHHAARSALYDLVCRASGHAAPAHPPYKHIAAVTLVLWLATAATACAVSDLGVVFQLAGGVAGSCIIFVLPGLLLVRTAADAGSSSAAEARLRQQDHVTGDVCEGVSVRAEHNAMLRPLGQADAGTDVRTDHMGTGALNLESPHRLRGTLRLLQACGWALAAVGVAAVCLTLYTTAARSGKSGGT